MAEHEIPELLKLLSGTFTIGCEERKRISACLLDLQSRRSVNAQLVAALRETVQRLDILLSRGDLASGDADEAATRAWLARCEAVLARYIAALEGR